VSQGDEDERAVTEYDKHGEYRQRHVLQYQLVVGQHRDFRSRSVSSVRRHVGHAVKRSSSVRRAAASVFTG